MTMILETEHHLRLDAIFQNQNLGKICWQKKPCWQRQYQYGWVNDVNTPTISPIPVHKVWLLELAVICTMKNITEWTISTQTNSPCEVRLFDLAVIGTILSVSLLDYEKQQDTGTGNLENFLLGKKLPDENENQKMKYKIQNTSYL